MGSADRINRGAGWCQVAQFYGARRVATELERRLGRPVNRKRMGRVYRWAGWSRSAPFRADTKACWKPIKAAKPNQVCQTDGWRYCFNISDIFTRW